MSAFPVPLGADVHIAAEEGVVGHPYLPGGDFSGWTLDVGDDLGQRDRAEFESDWAGLDPVVRGQLTPLIGLRGAKAQAARTGHQKRHTRLGIMYDPGLVIPKELALKVFRERLLPAYWARTLAAFDVSRLEVPARIALLSLVYNRGGKLTDNDPLRPETWRREEMRHLKDAAAEGDVVEMADCFVIMARLWSGGRRDDDGLVKRYERLAMFIDPSVGERLARLRDLREGRDQAFLESVKDRQLPPP